MNHTIDFQELIAYTNDVCLSLFLPTHPTHPELQQADQLQLRDLLDEARTKIEQLLQPAVMLLEEDGDCWSHQQGGLAVYLAHDFSRVYRFPLTVEPMVMVSGRFYIRPLLPLLTEDGRFYLLTLSQNQVHFFQASKYNMEEMILPNLPQGLDEVLTYDQPGKQLQFHGATGAHSMAGGQASIYYSVDVPTNYKKESLLRYCQAVDAALQHPLHQKSAPLVLACVDYLYAIYQHANSYPHLLPEWIAGSPDRVSDSTLHEKAWALVQPVLQQSRQDALAHFEDRAGQGRVLADVGRIVSAALLGRVETLLLATTRQHWGFVNPQTGELYSQEFATPHSQELVNLAAMYTVAKGGTVYAFQPGELPQGTEVAALLRY